MVEFYLSVWFFSFIHADGRVQKYHYSYSNRFKTVEECTVFNKTLTNHFPKENQIDPTGSELRYADYFCVEVKKPLEGVWSSQPADKPPLPPKRPSGL
jgi:hypothetical protein